MSVPNTSVKGKIFLLVIMLLACIGIIPLVTYHMDNPDIPNMVKVKSKQRNSKKKKNKINNKKKKPKKNRLENKSNKQDIPSKVQKIVKKSNSEIQEIKDEVASRIRQIEEEDSYRIRQIEEEDVEDEDESEDISKIRQIEEEEYNEINQLEEEEYDEINQVEEEEYDEINQVEEEDDDEIFDSKLDIRNYTQIINKEDSQSYEHIDIMDTIKMNENNIANNNIAKNNITGYDSTLDNTSLDIAFNSQTHDLNENTNNYSNLSNYDNSLDFVQDKANNRIDNMINQMSTTCPNQNEDIQTLANEVYIKKAIDELNLPQTMVYKINDVSYINSINISSVDEKNNNQIGVWYTAPATFLKITKTSAKLYIYTKAKIIVPAIIDYKPIFSGGLFISPNFQNYKNNLIEFKYNKDKDQMILKYKNVNTGNNHALNMIKLSPGLCSKVVHKIRDRDPISVKTSNLLLELLDDN